MSTDQIPPGCPTGTSTPAESAISSAPAAPGGTPPASPARTKNRLIGIDAARGLALIGLVAVHILPDETATGDPSLAWTLFSGDAAALFALLAGVGLAFTTGGSNPHRGRTLTAGRVGIAARALVIAALALVLAVFQPWEPPANGILLYYAVFFLLAIPFLHLRARTLFWSAAAFAVLSPVLLQLLGPVLPESSAYNHTIVTLLTEPLGSASELLLTGAYPALNYMTYLLVGLALGRLDLRSTRVQALIAGAGAAIAVASHLLSALLLGPAGGSPALMAATGMDAEDLDWALAIEPWTLMEVSGWGLAVDGPHANSPLAIGASLGVALLVTGLFLLITPHAAKALAPLAAMGSMTLTLYSAHLLALAPELHYEAPGAWFALHLVVALAFAWIWRQTVGRGPLERMVAAAARNARQLVQDQPARTTGTGASTTP